jgi:hypothetical protein
MIPLSSDPPRCMCALRGMSVRTSRPIPPAATRPPASCQPRGHFSLPRASRRRRALQPSVFASLWSSLSPSSRLSLLPLSQMSVSGRLCRHCCLLAATPFVLIPNGLGGSRVLVGARYCLLGLFIALCERPECRHGVLTLQALLVDVLLHRHIRILKYYNKQ